MKTITYQDNMQLWRMESAAEKAGYKKTEDCYWFQIFRAETGNEFCTSREEDSTNDPAADLAEMLTDTTEETTKAAENIAEKPGQLRRADQGNIKGSEVSPAALPFLGSGLCVVFSQKKFSLYAKVFPYFFPFRNFQYMTTIPAYTQKTLISCGFTALPNDSI